jgi:dihydrofolate reductase
MKPKIAIVVAKASNDMIGCSEGLPWRIPEELKYFKKVTLNKPIIMGRKTFESLGKPLANRTNIVLTRNGFNADGVIVEKNLKDAIETASTIAQRTGAEEIMIIGGSEIFKQSLPIVDLIYLTKIHESFGGNATLEGLQEDEWDVVSREIRFLQETKVTNNQLKCEFLVLKKKTKISYIRDLLIRLINKVRLIKRAYA